MASPPTSSLASDNETVAISRDDREAAVEEDEEANDTTHGSAVDAYHNFYLKNDTEGFKAYVTAYPNLLRDPLDAKGYRLHHRSTCVVFE